MYLIEDLNIADFVSDLFNSDQMQRTAQVVRRVGTEEFAKSLADKKRFISMEVTIAGTGGLPENSKEVSEAVLKINNRILSMSDIDTADIYTLARKTEDARRRSQYYSLYAGLVGKGDFRSTWAANNAGQIFLSEGRYEKAKSALNKAVGLGTGILALGELSSTQQKSVVEAISKAFSSYGFIALQNGDAIAAESSYVKAFKYGDPVGDIGLESIDARLAENRLDAM